MISISTTTRHVFVSCKGCKTVFEVHGEATPCPDCGSPYKRTRTEVSNLTLQERLYGTTNNPRFNKGLGTWTTGKRDRELKAAGRQMFPSG